MPDSVGDQGEHDDQTVESIEDPFRRRHVRSCTQRELEKPVDVTDDD